MKGNGVSCFSKHHYDHFQNVTVQQLLYHDERKTEGDVINWVEGWKNDKKNSSIYDKIEYNENMMKCLKKNLAENFSI